jgi:hypothetical protein
MRQFPTMLADHLIVSLIEEDSLRSIGPDDSEILIQK